VEEWNRGLGVLLASETRAETRVEELAARRDAARKARNWAEADQIRGELASLGWEVRDTADGAKLRRIQRQGGRSS
jgi:cysteinyl-tRNA synthetase